MRTKTIAAVLALSAVSAFGQTQIFRESFAFGANGLRPKSGKGRMTPAQIHTSFAGFWVENPANKNTTWMTTDTAGAQGWTWAGATTNPYEAPTPLDPTGTQNGIAYSIVDAVNGFQPAALLAPFSSPKTKFVVTADLMPRPILGEYTAVGLTNSNVLQDNFEASAEVWVRLRLDNPNDTFHGVAELHIQGLTGPTVSAPVLVSYNGFNHTQIVIDPVSHRATATVNGVLLGTLPMPAAATKYVGFEGSGGADNLVINSLP